MSQSETMERESRGRATLLNFVRLLKPTNNVRLYSPERTKWSRPMARTVACGPEFQGIKLPEKGIIFFGASALALQSCIKPQNQASIEANRGVALSTSE